VQAVHRPRADDPDAQDLRRHELERQPASEGLDERVRQAHHGDDPATPEVNKRATSETSQLNSLNGLRDRLRFQSRGVKLWPVFWYTR
jgi:hypothetical protein